MGNSKRSFIFRLIVVLTIVTPVVVLSTLQLAAPAVEGQTPPPSCTDSDGGLIYEVAGFVQGVGRTGLPYTKYDFCDTGDYDGYVREYYCSGTTPIGKRYQCPYGCVDNACLRFPPGCTDADGDTYAVEGGDCGLVDCDDSNPAVHPGATEICDNGIDDDCDGFTDAADPDCAVCTDADGDGYAIEGGVCGLVDCDDLNPAVHPGATEVCDNDIDDDCDGFTDAADLDCMAVPSCADSDGGLNYEVAGYVQGLNLTGRPYTKYDYCEAGDYVGYVREYYCSGTTAIGKRYHCAYGCTDKACLRFPPSCTDADGDGYAVEGGDCGPVDCDDTNPAVHPGATEVCDNGLDDDCNGLTDLADPACSSCTDSDGGFKYFRPGTVVDRDQQVYADECTAMPGEVREYACGPAGEAQSQTYACPNGCANGACVDPNVVVIGWDGTQRDHFLQCFNRQLPECANGLPNIQALGGGVILSNTITNGATNTKPGWAQLFTGYNAEVTGVYDLTNYQPIPEGYTTFEKIENHFGVDNVVTMFISGKGVHTGGACIGDWTTCNGQPCIEDKGQPFCFTKFHLDYFELNQNQNDAVGNRALQLLDTHQQDLFFALFLFRDPDPTGHISGEDSVNYSNAMIAVDTWLGTIVARLHELGIYDRTLIYVTSDHGFDEGASIHLNAPYTILATNDPLVVRSGDRKDVGPTILERYGISRGPIGTAPAVNGFSLYSIPALACIPEGEAYVEYPGAPVCCSGLTLIGLDKKYGSCLAATGGIGDDSGYCTACGNGVCQAPEHKCNCPADCF